MPPFSKRGYLKIITKCIHCFCSHPIQPNAFLKCFAVVFCSCIYFTYHIHHFSQRYSPAKVTNSNRFFFFIYGKINIFSMTHSMFIYAVVHHLFYQYINTIVRAATISQFSYIHTWAQPNVFTPVKASNAIFVIIVIHFIICHFLEVQKVRKV